jgi:predicted nucleotidyltransferase
MAVQPIIDQRSVIDETLIREVTDRIVKAFNPRRITLFGSWARGDAKPHSDMDLMVEMETDLPFFDRIRAVNELFGLRRWSMDLLVYTPSEVERDSRRNGTLVELANREGKVLYERA